MGRAPYRHSSFFRTRRFDDLILEAGMLELVGGIVREIAIEIGTVKNEMTMRGVRDCDRRVVLNGLLVLMLMLDHQWGSG